MHIQFSPVLPRVPKESILEPILFFFALLMIFLLLSNSSNIYTLFSYADEMKYTKKVSSATNYLWLQEDLPQLSSWSLKWQQAVESKVATSMSTNALFLLSYGSRSGEFIFKDILQVECIQRCATKYNINDYLVHL